MENISASKVKTVRNRVVHMLKGRTLTKISIVIVVLVAAHFLATIFSKLITYFVSIPKQVVDDPKKHKPLVQGLFGSVTYWLIIAIVLVMIPTWIGFETASIVAVLVGLVIAVGIGLQGTLADLAAGLMLTLNNTYLIGDYIEVPDLNLIGRVADFGILYTYIIDEDSSTRISIPNRSMYENVIYNHTIPTEHTVVNEVMISNTNQDMQAFLEKLKDSVQSFPGVLNKPGFEVTCNVSEVTALGTKIEIRYALRPQDFQIKGTRNKRAEISTHIRETLTSLGVTLVNLDMKTQVIASEKSGD